MTATRVRRRRNTYSPDAMSSSRRTPPTTLPTMMGVEAELPPCDAEPDAPETAVGAVVVGEGVGAVVVGAAVGRCVG